jgi:hypothetical protein
MSETNLVFDCANNTNKQKRSSKCAMVFSQKGTKRMNTSTNVTQVSKAMRYAEYLRMRGNTDFVNNNG